MVEGIAGVSAGDIIHSEFSDGVPQLCMVTAVTSQFIHAWDFPRGWELLFDKSDGSGAAGPDREISRIVCVAPLPQPVHAVLASMYERYRFGAGDDRARLTLDERAALRTVNPFIAANRLPDVPA